MVYFYSCKLEKGGEKIKNLLFIDYTELTSKIIRYPTSFLFVTWLIFFLSPRNVFEIPISNSTSINLINQLISVNNINWNTMYIHINPNLKYFVSSENPRWDLVRLSPWESYQTLLTNHKTQTYSMPFYKTLSSFSVAHSCLKLLNKFASNMKCRYSRIKYQNRS